MTNKKSKQKKRRMNEWFFIAVAQQQHWKKNMKRTRGAEILRICVCSSTYRFLISQQNPHELNRIEIIVIAIKFPVSRFLVMCHNIFFCCFALYSRARRFFYFILFSFAIKHEISFHMASATIAHCSFSVFLLLLMFLISTLNSSEWVSYVHMLDDALWSSHTNHIQTKEIEEEMNWS